MQIMDKSEDLLKQFDKVFESLHSLPIECQLDVIRRTESKLNSLKNSIENQLMSKTNGKEISNNLKNNLNLNSVQNVRKSKRISNRLSIESDLKTENRIKLSDELNDQKTDEEHNDRNERQLDNNSDFNTNEQNETSVSEKAIHSSNSSSVPQSEPKDNKVVAKRKWRRAQDINDRKCKFCGKIWRSLSHLEIHLRSHTGEKIFECQQCGHRFAQLTGLQVHLRRHNNDRQFKCEVCDKGFYTKIDLNRHKSSHKQFRQITHCCEICGKGFSDNRKLKNHIRYVHEKKESIVCEICGHKTHGQHLLNAHKRVKHGQSSKYGCLVCSAVLGSRSALVIHLRAHAEVKPCACDICGKQFRSSSQVARHKLSHREGQHECDICLKRFKTPHHLRRHKVIHSGEKPFKCHLCEYKCNVNSNIVKHVKSVHGIVDFSLVTQQKAVPKQIEAEALQKGSIVAQEVLKDIALTKGQKITLKELKKLDEIKKREKQLLIEEMSQTLNHRKQLKREKIQKRKDILDDAITSTFNDHNSQTQNDNRMTELPLNIAIEVTSAPELRQIIIPESVHIFNIITDSSETKLN